MGLLKPIELSSIISVFVQNFPMQHAGTAFGISIDFYLRTYQECSVSSQQAKLFCSSLHIYILLEHLHILFYCPRPQIGNKGQQYKWH